MNKPPPPPYPQTVHTLTPPPPAKIKKKVFFILDFFVPVLLPFSYYVSQYDLWCSAVAAVLLFQSVYRSDNKACNTFRPARQHLMQKTIFKFKRREPNDPQKLTSVDVLRLPPSTFLLCYSMNYRDFSVKSKLIISLFQTFHCFENSNSMKQSHYLLI